jgi:hypothetical protein
MQKHFSSFFADVPDPRSRRNQKHDFLAIIGTAILAALSGIDIPTH